MSLVRIALAVAIGLGVGPAAAETGAEEYRLQVANLYRQTFTYYLDGPIGRGAGELAMPKLEAALDSGEVPLGALLGDRPLRYGWDDLNRAFGAVKVRAVISRGGGEGRGRWDEAVWQGTPGERTVWVIAPVVSQFQQVYNTAVKGSAPDAALRYYIPYRVTGNPTPATVVAYPLSLLHFYADRGTLWTRYLSQSVSLSSGMAAIVGVNDNASFADWVYIVVQQPAHPATVKLVLGWDRRQLGEAPNVQIWSN